MNQSELNAKLQQFIPTPQILISSGAAGGGSGSVAFRVPCPDPRLRTKITVAFAPVVGSSATALAATATLWLAEGEWDRSGASGRILRCTNVEGTQAAPTAIATAGLLGYSRELITAADTIEGVLTATVGSFDVLGSWMLQCRYSPQSVRFTDKEWDEITRQCNPSLTSRPINFP